MNYYQVKLIKNLSEHKKIFFWTALIWTIIVAFLCLTSFNQLTKTPKNFDKFGHITIHFGITLLWFLYFKYKASKVPSKKAALKAFLFSLFYGIVIEIIQGVFTTTRKPDFFDVVANMVGSALAISMLVFIYKVLKRHF